jgi:hypothetical protein
MIKCAPPMSNDSEDLYEFEPSFNSSRNLASSQTHILTISTKLLPGLLIWNVEAYHFECYAVIMRKAYGRARRFG